MKNREIKFRVWDNNSKMFVKQELVCLYATGYYTVIDECNEGVIAYNGDNIGSEFYLMQYTGLKDKNGKEIFEGDIVQDEYFVPKPIKMRPQEVFYSQVDCSFALRPSNPFDHMALCYSENRAIIGNIYENSELLEANNGK